MLDSERVAKVNHITSSIREYMDEFPPKHKGEIENILSYFSSIICQLDTDIAIKVMEEFGEIGKNQALSIKINYGY